jgi:hypothetical protein
MLPFVLPIEVYNPNSIVEVPHKSVEAIGHNAFFFYMYIAE